MALPKHYHVGLSNFYPKQPNHSTLKGFQGIGKQF
jgi:hypothetical protein